MSHKAIRHRNVPFLHRCIHGHRDLSLQGAIFVLSPSRIPLGANNGHTKSARLVTLDDGGVLGFSFLHGQEF